MKYFPFVLILVFVILGCETDTNSTSEKEAEYSFSAPSLHDPADGAVTGSKPVLIVVNIETDIPDPVIYTFQVADNPDFTSPIRIISGVSEGIDVTAWRVDPELDKATQYWWRARAETGLISGDWMEIASFTVGDTATLIDPPDGALLLEFRPGFTVLDPGDSSNNDQFAYTFQVAEDPAFSYPILSIDVPHGSTGSTTFHPSNPLPYGIPFWWRVQVKYSEDDGIWSDSSRFAIFNPEFDARILTDQFVTEIENSSLAMSGWSTNSPYYNLERSELINNYRNSTSIKIEYSILGFAEQDDFLVENIDATFIWSRKFDGRLITDHGLWILMFVVEDYRWKIYSSFFYKQP